MFRFLKKLFGGSVEEVAEVQPEINPDAPSPSSRRTTQPRPAPRGPPADTLTLPLSVVLAQLPGDLQARVNQSYAAQVNVAVPTGRILPQLAHGSVKISFGELRQAAPTGTFSDEDDLDQSIVDLPLSEILSRVSPALLARRTPRKKVEAPEEVVGPFGAKGQGLIVAAPPPKQYAPPPMAPVKPQPESAPVVAKPAATASIPPTTALRDLIAPPAAAPPAAAPPAAAPLSAAPVDAGPTPPRQLEYLMVALGELSEAWPEAVRQEIVQLNLSGALLALPMEQLEHELKHGKVAFTWKLLRSMIKPLPASSAVSVHDGVVLDLPLRILAPLFLAHQRASKAQAKTPLAETIPDVFSSSARATAAAPPTETEFLTTATPPPRREDETNYYIWKDDADTPDPASPAPKPAAASAHAQTSTSFLKRFPTPNEVVRKATTLEGVVGSLIALADGLLVAKELPPEMNGETIAAFLPQIFGRTSQSARELKMGELNNLSFTVGNVPWKIFRVGGMFFAAFGRPGQPLPGAQLVTIVAELDRKQK